MQREKGWKKITKMINAEIESAKRALRSGVRFGDVCQKCHREKIMCKCRRA
jgi:hypothetical protein